MRVAGAEGVDDEPAACDIRSDEQRGTQRLPMLGLEVRDAQHISLHSSCHAGGAESARRITAMTSSSASWGSTRMNTPSRYAYQFSSTPSYAVSLSASRAAGTPRRSSRDDSCTRTPACYTLPSQSKRRLAPTTHAVEAPIGR